MLKSIELYGFKSFADRTRMELDEGICALVGPNGSGKSNVVDAIKWALGEQSAKRLRGDEMTDVIFNGSASRAPMGSAEVTITFDNRKRVLPLDADEIHLTRRVYRGGESEYLVNGQASRLKDFRDLIGGAGLGSQGYAVIEQGRVEALLQSSGAQRRAALEEAAGVARFNAKKQEVARRLERVEQNLLRLSDVVGEVESQLRKTKAQAGKAEHYRAYAARLQKLRTEVSLYEWRLKTAELNLLNEETDSFSEFEADVSAKIQAGEAEQAVLTSRLKTIEDELRQAEAELSASREKIAAEEASVEFQVGRITEWTAEASRNATQALELASKGADGDATTRQTREELDEERAKIGEIKASTERENAELERLGAKAADLTRQGEDARRDLQKKNGEISLLSGEIAGLASRARTLEQSRSQKTSQSEEVEGQQKELTDEIQRLNNEETTLETKRAESFEHLGDLKRRREDLRRELGARQVEFSDLERKRTAYDERSTILRDLLRKYEGLSPGVKETLRAMRDPTSPFSRAYGLVADLIRVNVEAASLIELALGQTAQYVVVPPEPELFRHIELNGGQFAGRVGFIWLDPNPGASIPLDPRLEKSEGVLGRADQFVETEPRFSALVQRLLHRTWIVESISVAKRLYRDASEPVNFLTADGSLLTADGTLVVGSAQGGAGLISRRSELATLSQETEKLDGEFGRIREEVALFKSELATADADFEKEASVQLDVKQALEELRLRQTSALERETQLAERREQLRKELQDLVRELAKTSGELETKQQTKNQLEQNAAALAKQEAEIRQELNNTTNERQERAKRATNLKIELVKAEERAVSLEDRLKNLLESQSEQSRRSVDHQRRSDALLERIAQAELKALNGESAIAELYWKKELLAERRNRAATERSRLERLRSKTAFDLRSNREALEKRREQNRTKEISSTRFTQEIKSLEERMKEDYNLDLSATEFKIEGIDDLDRRSKSPSTTDDSMRDEKNQNKASDFDDSRELVVPNDPAGAKKRKKEIEELRVKLQELGSVNLEAIETLETLKTRYTTLFNQYNDLVAARKSIQKIVERVNAECRKMFEEAFEAVRGNFCSIFQKLFGGGRADLTLENPSNPLESGVDVAAKPPGKELKSLSLMSGGEKSLTCVALLLAIFQYRTSPVCILDEVDAALDEGNVSRFSNALADFPSTQFLLVTHSKKTMSSAKAIYGVTMEDSGVSKILSVHFDDVGEDGEILVKSKTPVAERPRLMRGDAA